MEMWIIYADAFDVDIDDDVNDVVHNVVVDDDDVGDRDAKSGKHGKHACAIFSPKLC